MTAAYDQRARRDTPLADKLRARIRRDGPIPVDAYIAACLYDPAHGYYVHRAAIGTDGDFTTAPEISQVFGELIGLWALVVWQQLGCPSPFYLVEFGPGRGTLMRDALRAMRVRPAIFDAIRVQLIDTSATFTSQQRSTLAEFSVPIAWPGAFANADDPTRPAIVIANEFLDTTPIRQFVRTTDGWAVRRVGLDASGHLAFVTSPDCPPDVATDLGARFPTARPDDVCEIATVDDGHMAALTRLPRQVAGLIIDYGHTRSSPGDTLQAVRRHGHEHPLTSPGEADLSAQVDFQQVADAFRRAGLGVDGPITQAAFLGALGIAERGQRLIEANPTAANAIEMAIARLMSGDGMGRRFKVLGVRSADSLPLPGFSTAEPM